MRKFHLGDVLSVITRINVSPRLMKGVFDITSFMVGHEIEPAENIVLYADQCRASLLEQHPNLKKVSVAGVNTKNWKQWLSTQVKKYGEKLSVKPISA
ncbi:MAG: hypothetical protein HYW89_01310 [Candidatus Sungiibacteriota bacterium]|uniref:DUF7736 domain-containing protein n=1 Tax=Candidatus Sungiibacteriota bacterium TaxID=2750080 RepID=A0A7T5RK33_9BACT|nr:MAG: hypothetical protein HYW89_01310 [Candidatus Sungbacteria bacterium]